MCRCSIAASVVLLIAALCACAPEQNTSLTQWGTPCASYDLSPQECHAKFANYAQYMGQSDPGTMVGKLP